MTNDEQPTTAERLGALLGEWEAEAVFPSVGPEAVVGRTTFEPILNGSFVLQRSSVDLPAAPDSLSVLAAHPDSGTFTQHYFDSRGVVRSYAMTFVDRTWTLLRLSPDFSPLGFSQRFIGELSSDGDAISGAWEQSDDGVEWRHDFKLDFRRSSG